MMKLYQACIFDMDGTLINTLDSIAHFANAALNKFGFAPIPPADYKTLVGNGADVLILRMLAASGAPAAAVPAAGLRREYDRLYEADPTHLVAPYPGIDRLLRQLKERGVKLGVLSNKPDNMVQYLAAHFFPDTFDAVLGQRDNLPKKPNPATLLQMAAHLGCRPEEILYCGDSGVDMQTGKNAGVKTAGVLWGFRDRKELAENGADFLAETAEALLDIFLNPSLP